MYSSSCQQQTCNILQANSNHRYSPSQRRPQIQTGGIEWDSLDIGRTRGRLLLSITYLVKSASTLLIHSNVIVVLSYLFIERTPMQMSLIPIRNYTEPLSPVVACYSCETTMTSRSLNAYVDTNHPDGAILCYACAGLDYIMSSNLYEEDFEDDS